MINTQRLDHVLWHATAPEVAQRPPLAAAIDAEVAIIGGGFTGLSAALHLAEAGTRVVLLEQGCLGWGASGRNAGVVAPLLARGDPDDVVARLGSEQGERLNALVAASGPLLFDLARRTGIDCEAEQTGYIQPVHNDAAQPLLARRVDQWAARGKPVRLLDRAAVTAMTGARCFRAALVDASGGQINPLKFVRALAMAAEKAGAVIFEDTAVRRMVEGAGHWRLETPVGTVTAGRVILATNAHVGDLWPGLARSFLPLQVHQLATEPVDAATAARILPGRQAVTDARAYPFSFRFDRDNRLISGGIAALPFGAEARIARHILRRLARLLELDATPRADFVWQGTAALTMDFLPRLLRPAPGLLAVLGFNGRGIALATAFGKVLADLARDEDVPPPLPIAEAAPIAAHWLVRHGPRFYIPWARARDALATPRGGLS